MIFPREPITTWLDDVCSHCSDCGWSDFPEQAPDNVCPDCGGKVIPPTDEDEAIDVEAEPLSD